MPLPTVVHVVARERVIIGAVLLAVVQFIANGGDLTWEAVGTVAAGAILSCLVTPSKPGIRRPVNDQLDTPGTGGIAG